jgi:phage shock protein PspC (stress-responsive transcriptional regulator)
MPDEIIDPNGPADREGPASEGPASEGPAREGPAAAGERPAAGGGYPGQPGQPGHPGYAGYPGYPAGYPAPGAQYPPPHGGYPDQFSRRMTRRMDDRVIAGVGSGLGAYFNVDPVIFRVGFVALTFAGGVGLIIYLLCWILLPPAYGPQPGAAHAPQGQWVAPNVLRQGGWKTYLAMGLVLLALVLLFSPFTRPTVVFALLLIGLGVMLMARDQPDEARPPGEPGAGGQWPGGGWQGPGGGPRPGQPAPGGQWQPGATAGPPPASGQAPGGGEPPATGQAPPGAEPPVTGRAPESAAVVPSPGEHPTAPVPRNASGSGPAWTQPGAPDQPGGWGGPAAWQASWGRPAVAAPSTSAASGWGSTATAVREPARPRPRSVIAWVTVALALLAAGVAGALDNFGVVSMTPASTLGLMLAVVGAGTLVASVLGRAGWLIVIGCLLLPAAGLASVMDGVTVSGRAGDLVAQPANFTEVKSTYRLGAGDMRIDLSRVTFKTPQTIEVRLGAGDIRIVVPKGQPVQVNTRIGAGEARVLGHEDQGVQVRSEVTDGTSEQLGKLTLNLRAGLGEVSVERAP